MLSDEITRIPRSEESPVDSVQLDRSRLDPRLATALYALIECKLVISDDIEKGLNGEQSPIWSEATRWLERNLQRCAVANIDPQTQRFGLGVVPMTPAEFVLQGTSTAIGLFGLLGHDLIERGEARPAEVLSRNHRPFGRLADNNAIDFGILQAHMGTLGDMADRTHRFQLNEAGHASLGDELQEPDYEALTPTAQAIQQGLVAEAFAQAKEMEDLDFDAVVDASFEPFDTSKAAGNAPSDEDLDFSTLFSEERMAEITKAIEAATTIDGRPATAYELLNNSRLITTGCPARLNSSILGDSLPQVDGARSLLKGTGINHTL